MGWTDRKGWTSGNPWTRAIVIAALAGLAPRIGRIGPEIRLPLTPLTASGREKLDPALDALGLKPSSLAHSLPVSG